MFLRIFQELWKDNASRKKWLCVGLDSDLAKLPEGQTQLSFNQALIETTADLAGAYKPNAAFYESQGTAGWETLQKTVAFIHEKAPRALVILDAKRGDIGNTNAGYAQAAFDFFRVDAITLNPYLGGEALQPFLDYKDKGCFILCRTSNAGAKEFQELVVEGEPLYLRVARQVAREWNKNRNCGLVVGATAPEELKKVRSAAPDLPFLIPGVGAQGGDLKTALEQGSGKNGGGVLINVSRSVIFASSGADFAQVAREAILDLLERVSPCPPVP